MGNYIYRNNKIIILEKNNLIISKKLLEKAHKDGIEKNVVRLVVKENNAILMLKRAKNERFSDLYELPGGKLNENEDIFSGAKRELCEETGLSIKEFTSKPESYDFGAISDNKKYRGYILNVLCEKKDIILNPTEHCEYKWVIDHEVENLPMLDNIKTLIKKFF